MCVHLISWYHCRIKGYIENWITPIVDTILSARFLYRTPRHCVPLSCHVYLKTIWFDLMKVARCAHPLFHFCLYLSLARSLLGTFEFPRNRIWEFARYFHSNTVPLSPLAIMFAFFSIHRLNTAIVSAVARCKYQWFVSVTEHFHPLIWIENKIYQTNNFRAGNVIRAGSLSDFVGMLIRYFDANKNQSIMLSVLNTWQ